MFKITNDNEKLNCGQKSSNSLVLDAEAVGNDSEIDSTFPDVSRV